LTVWDDYYRNSDSETVIKDRNFFRLEVEALSEHVVNEARRAGGAPRILELGSGTGFLAATLTRKLSDEGIAYSSYVGVDFSKVATDKAIQRNIPRTQFVAADFIEFLERAAAGFDLVVTQRSIMAVTDLSGQLRLLDMIRSVMTNQGVGIFSEGVTRGLKKLQAMRESLGVTAPFEKVWHSLYVDEDELFRRFHRVETFEFSSLYWLITRVIYPYFTEPKHNTPIHDFVATLPQDGPFGLVKLYVARC
jgi:SAM-dependent methyltransferase